MTKTEVISDQTKATPEPDRKKEKDRPPSKIVIRRLPPSLTPEDFLEQVSPLPDHDFFYFVRADMSLGTNAYTRAYINFLHAEDIFIFRDKFDGYVFLDAKGGEFPALVEFSPFQKVPKKKPRKVDSRCGMLEQDGDYKKFLDHLANPPEPPTVSLDAIVEEVEAKELRIAKMGSTKTNTPLLEFLKRRKEEKRMNLVKMRDERRRGGGRDRDRDYDRRRSGKDEGDRRDRDRLKDRERRKDRGKDRVREKEKERRRERDRGGGGSGVGRHRDKRAEEGDKPKPIMLLKNTDREGQGKESSVNRTEHQNEGRQEGEEGRLAKEGGGDSWEERKGSGGDKSRRGEEAKDRKKDWDERLQKSGRDRGRGGGGGDLKKKNDEWRDRGGKWKEEGRGRGGGGGGRGGRGDDRDEDNYHPRRNERKWEEKGNRDRFGKDRERERDMDKDKRGGGGGARERMKEDQKRGGSGGGGGGGGGGRNRDRDEWRDNRDDGRPRGGGGRGGGGGKNSRDGDNERKRSDRDRPGERRGGGGSEREREGGRSKDHASQKVKDSDTQADNRRARDYREAGSGGGGGGAGGSKDDKDRDKRREEDGKRPEREPRREWSPRDEGQHRPRVTKSEEGGDDKTGNNATSESGEAKRKRKDRPERQIYIPRRALEKQRQNSPQSGEGDGTKGKT